ncbi:class I SAM-dependent methyltransferase [Sinomonas sp. R1AF57]|uniref:class I SAM-dependent methyltransferase n=1 Tax=Sinomonas sp. R1AF57 TaxID=2020377 RepID=UPI000B60B114|nr:methyltransferase [Sinomonas sp. R1AF57]ASN51657.1 16S rRNA methyltransferase [Sinomonas sp. R1AF57]
MEPAHYFNAEPDVPDARKPLDVVLDGRPVKLTTSSGIFSPDGIDKGTAVLLGEAPDPAGQGDLLDIGCGWGPIALTMALRSPEATVHAVDVNTRSVALTRDNASALGLSNVVAGLPGEVDPELRFATIWSNPPIRIGKQALHELLLTWLPRLAVGGDAWLVVQKNLGADSLQRWLADELGDAFEVAREATSKGFRLLRVTRMR